MKVFVTGASGCLASALLPVLCRSSAISHVTGIDLKPASFTDPKYRHHQLDMRDPQIEALMSGHDAVVHLGFAISQGSMSRNDMDENNIGGSQRVIEAARKLGIGRFVNMSSVSVYGPGAGMTESTPLRPHAWFPYAQQKAEVESLLTRAIPTATQFRAQLVIGRHAQDFLRDLFRSPVWFDFGGNPPTQQVVHEDDVVEAIMIAVLDPKVSGIYNLAASEEIQIAGNYIRHGLQGERRIRRVPFALVRGIAGIGKLFLKKDLLTLVSMLGTSATVKCDKAKSIRWYPRRTPWDARFDAMRSFDQGEGPTLPLHAASLDDGHGTVFYFVADAGLSDAELQHLGETYLSHDDIPTDVNTLGQINTQTLVHIQERMNAPRLRIQPEGVEQLGRDGTWSELDPFTFNDWYQQSDLSP